MSQTTPDATGQPNPFNPMSNSFDHINETTGKAWTRQELWDQWHVEKEVLASTDAENALLRRQLTKALKERDVAAESFLTVKQYLTDFKLRVKEHNKHFTEAIIDVKQLGVDARKASEPALAKFSSLYGSLSTNFKK
jgi:hypothetical protein